MKIILDSDDTTYILTAALRALRAEGIGGVEIKDLSENWKSDKIDEVRIRIVNRLKPRLNKIFEGLEVGGSE